MKEIEKLKFETHNQRELKGQWIKKFKRKR